MWGGKERRRMQKTLHFGNDYEEKENFKVDSQLVWEQNINHLAYIINKTNQILLQKIR